MNEIVDIIDHIEDVLRDVTPGMWMSGEDAGIPEAYLDHTIAAVLRREGNPTIVTDVARKVFNEADRRLFIAAPRILREAEEEIAGLRVENERLEDINIDLRIELDRLRTEVATLRSTDELKGDES